MGILNDNKTNKEMTVEEIKQELKNSYASIKSASANISALIFNNSNCTPQEIFDELGISSAEVVGMSAIAIQIMNTYGGENIQTLVPAGLSITVNNDGTVTVLN